MERLLALAALAQRIGHDLNNALTAALGFAGVALADPEVPSGVRSCLENVSNAAERAAELAQQLIAIHRRMGRSDRAAHDINAVLRDLDPLLRALTGKTELELKLCDGDPSVLAEEADLEQAAVALVQHARSRAAGLPIELRTEALELSEVPAESAMVPGPYASLAVSAGVEAAGAPAPRTLASLEEATEHGLEIVFRVARKIGGSLERGATSSVRLLVPMSEERSNGR